MIVKNAPGIDEQIVHKTINWVEEDSNLQPATAPPPPITSTAPQQQLFNNQQPFYQGPFHHQQFPWNQPFQQSRNTFGQYPSFLQSPSKSLNLPDFNVHPTVPTNYSTPNPIDFNTITHDNGHSYTNLGVDRLPYTPPTPDMEQLIKNIT